MFPILKNVSNLLNRNHKTLLIRNFFLIIINTFLETLSIAMVIPVLTIILSPKEYTNYFFFNYVPKQYLINDLNLIFITLGIMIILFLIKFFFKFIINSKKILFLLSLLDIIFVLLVCINILFLIKSKSTYAFSN